MRHDSFTARRAVVSLNGLYDDRFILGLASATFRWSRACAATITKNRSGDARLSRGHQQKAHAGPAEIAAGHGCGARTEDAGADGAEGPWRVPTT